jgi:hypothetical protein
MSDTDNTHTTSNSDGDPTRSIMRLERQVEALQRSLKAVSEERNTLKGQLKANADRLSDYDQLKTSAAQATQRLTALQRTTALELALAEKGITSKRARRLLMREYEDEFQDVAHNERPGMADYLTSIQGDPFLSRLLPSTTAEPQATAPATAPATTDATSPTSTPAPATTAEPQATAPATTQATGTQADPNTGATSATINGNAQPMTNDQYKRMRAQHGGRLKGKALERVLSRLASEGVIST